MSCFDVGAWKQAYTRVRWSCNMQTGKTSYWVADDPRLRASVRSTHQKTPACSVELGWDKLYDTFDDALAVANRVYGQAQQTYYRTALADDYILDESYICHRSFAHYAGHDEYAKNLSYSRDFWDGFQLSSAYNKMMGQGGTKSQKDVDELMAAAEAYRWEKAYRKFDVYDEDMFEFADKMRRDTGVTVTTRGGNGRLAIYRYFGDKLCKMGNTTFQFMAKHQEHIDIWEDAVRGKYATFDELHEAVLQTGDKQLEADWQVMMRGTKGGLIDSVGHRRWLYNIVGQPPSVSASKEGYDSLEEGKTALDFWNEFRYDRGLTDTYENHRSVKDFFWENSLHWIEDSRLREFADELFDKSDAEVPYLTGANERSGRSYFDAQIDILRERIQGLRRKLAAAKNGMTISGADTKTEAEYKSQIAVLETQIATIKKQQELEQKYKQYR